MPASELVAPVELLTLLISFVVVPGALALVATIRVLSRQAGLDLAAALTYFFSRTTRRQIAAWTNLRRYCRTVLAAPNTKYLHIPGSDKSTALEIDDLFVKLRLDWSSPHATEVTDETLLTVANRLQVVGDPGSGKSSLVKKVLRELCRAGSRRPRGARIPVLIELRELSIPDDADDRWLYDHVRERVGRVEGHEMDRFFDLLAGQSGIVVFLDGLDEVSSTDYDRTRAQIMALSRILAERSTANTVVLTMRTQFHQQVHRDFIEQFPTSLYVKPFRAEEIYEFLTRWFPGTDSLAKAGTVYGELAERPNLREMCGNPLILSMYINDYTRLHEAELPDTRTEFYKSVVDELVIRRRARQLNDRAGRRAKRSDRLAVLGRIAFENLTDPDQPANSISWDKAVAATRALLTIPSDDLAAQTLLDLGRDTGLFVEERHGETIRFIHLTFCEYLAALDATQNQRGGWDALVAGQRAAAGTSGASRLAEVIPFAVGMTPRSTIDRVLDEVWELEQPGLYVRSILESQHYSHQCWQKYVLQERDWLISQPDDEWNHAWLDRLQLYLTAVAECASIDSKAVVGYIDMLFVGLVGDQRNRLIHLFSTYAAENPGGAFRFAASCGVDLAQDAPHVVAREAAHPPFLAVCLEIAQSSANASSWCAIFACAGLKHSIAAQMLSRAPAPARWIAAAERAPRANRWHTIFTDNASNAPSMYGVALTLASAQISGLSEPLVPSRLIDLSRLKAPRIGLSTALDSAPAIVAAVSFVIFLGYYVGDALLNFGIILPAVLGYSMGLAFFVLPIANRSRSYRSLVNLGRFDIPKSKLISKLVTLDPPNPLMGLVWPNYNHALRASAKYRDRFWRPIDGDHPM